MPLGQSDTSHLDEDSVESRADHAAHKGKLLALPQVCQRSETETLADVLDTQALIVGEDRSGRNGRDVGVRGLYS